MLSSTLRHLAINWDNLDPMFKYASVDPNGVWAHVEKPYLNDDGYYTSHGATMFLMPTETILFQRDIVDPIEPVAEPNHAHVL